MSATRDTRDWAILRRCVDITSPFELGPTTEERYYHCERMDLYSMISIGLFKYWQIITELNNYALQ
jgi:hypothetical protein